MHPLLGLLGAGLVLVALVDMLWTTLAVSAGGGPITSTVSRGLWEALCRLGKRRSHPHRFLRWAGVAVVTSVFVIWVGLFVLGWWLVFSSSPGAVRNATTGAPVGWIARLYFVGFTTSTLGIGDLVPGDGLWRLLTVVAAFSGLSVVTMSITYLLPVASAVVDRRTLATGIASLGDNPPGIVVNAWSGGGWVALEQRLPMLEEQLVRLGQRHLAYPVLHFFHDVAPEAAAGVTIARLDEALTLLRFGVTPEARPHALVVDSARTSVAAFLSTLSSAHIGPSAELPAPPSLAPLRRAGVPTVSDEDFTEACADLDQRRRLLRGFLEDDGWTWAALDRDRHVEGDEAADDAVAPEEVEEDAGTDAR